jgi:hypothetical protein
MSLAESQARFLERLLAPAGEPSPGIAVYRRTLRGNRHEALRAAYPVVARLVGDAFFIEAAARFADEVPSRSGDLHEYGAGFDVFLGAYPHAASLGYLPDVARLEWAAFRCAFAPDPSPLDLAALAAIPIEERATVRFLPQPGTALFASGHPVVSIWEANQPPRDGEVEAAWQPETALVFRRGLQVVVSRVGPEARMLSRLLRGEALEAACETASDAESLPGWVQAGLFGGIAP